MTFLVESATEPLDVLVFEVPTTDSPEVQVREKDLGTDLLLVTSSGPPGPQGKQGPPGPAGDASAVEIDLANHLGQTTNVHGIADTSQLVIDDIPTLTLIFENGLI